MFIFKMIRSGYLRNSLNYKVAFLQLMNILRIYFQKVNFDKLNY